MNKAMFLTLLASSALAASAAPAAEVVGGFTLDTGSFGEQTGVHFDGSPSGSSVSGYINQDDSGVTFSTTTGGLNVTGGSGQAAISGDPLIENLNVVFEKAWDSVTFNFAGDAGSFQLLVNGSALFASPTCTICTISNGSNKFTLSGTGITNLGFTFNPGVTSTRQFRVEGVTAVPEAATWTMMIAGLGLAGLMLRRRAAKVQFA